MSLRAYIRNQKLSNATFNLLHEGMSVTETAFPLFKQSCIILIRSFQVVFLPLLIELDFPFPVFTNSMNDTFLYIVAHFRIISF